VKYIDDLVLLANDEAMLQGMSDRLREIGRCCGMAANVGRKKKKSGNENFKATIPSKKMVDQKQEGNVE